MVTEDGKVLVLRRTPAEIRELRARIMGFCMVNKPTNVLEIWKALRNDEGLHPPIADDRTGYASIRGHVLTLINSGALSEDWCLKPGNGPNPGKGTHGGHCLPIVTMLASDFEKQQGYAPPADPLDEAVGEMFDEKLAQVRESVDEPVADTPTPLVQEVIESAKTDYEDRQAEEPEPAWPVIDEWQPAASNQPAHQAFPGTAAVLIAGIGCTIAGLLLLVT